jgi:hypothetical protein
VRREENRENGRAERLHHRPGLTQRWPRITRTRSKSMRPPAAAEHKNSKSRGKSRTFDRLDGDRSHRAARGQQAPWAWRLVCARARCALTRRGSREKPPRCWWRVVRHVHRHERCASGWVAQAPRQRRAVVPGAPRAAVGASRPRWPCAAYRRSAAPFAPARRSGAP